MCPLMYDVKVVVQKPFADILGFFTMDKSMVSSAKNMTLDFIFLSRSLVQTRNNRGPRTEPWGTPDSILQ